jgi:CheY-like chemotaxis protein
LESKSKVEIIEATNGQEALEKLAQYDFDIVLMDIQMPVMNGYEATQRIRTDFPSPKKDVFVIALTASVIRSDLDKCRSAGMDDYVPKPFKPVQLFTAIATHVGRDIKFKNCEVSLQTSEKQMVLQHTDLAYLQSFCEGDKAKMQKYIRIFLDSVPLFISKLNVAMKEFDAQEIAAQVHGFKTKFVMMGMEETKLFAAQLEADCHIENPEQTVILTNTMTLIKMISAAETELKINYI